MEFGSFYWGAAEDCGELFLGEGFDGVEGEGFDGVGGGKFRDWRGEGLAVEGADGLTDVTAIE